MNNPTGARSFNDQVDEEARLFTRHANTLTLAPDSRANLLKRLIRIFLRISQQL